MILQENYICYSYYSPPLRTGGKSNEAELLAMAYQHSVKLAVEHHLPVIFFPKISTGIYHPPKDEAIEAAVRAGKVFLTLTDKITGVFFVCLEKENYDRYYNQLD